ncbi:MAG TPA: lmo0937 family membrane protein [Bacteroidia bacterium]|nr:lmo0937 family membrane protein [Bacteroidia bacterium]
MSSLLYVIAVILVICWAVGFFAYSAGYLIHILLVLALIAILIRIIQGRNPV